MKRRAFAMAVAAVLSVAAPSRASLTSSEAEQVRRGVADRDRSRPRQGARRASRPLERRGGGGDVRAADDDAVDPAHVAFLHDLVFGRRRRPRRARCSSWRRCGACWPAPTRSSRSTGSTSTGPLRRSRELQRAYAFVEQVAVRGRPPSDERPRRRRGRSARARSPTTSPATRRCCRRRPPWAPPSRACERRLAIALLDLMPDGADAPNRRGRGARADGGRAGPCSSSAGCSRSTRAGPTRTSLRSGALLDRLPALRDGLEAIVVGGDAGGPLGARRAARPS